MRKNEDTYKNELTKVLQLKKEEVFLYWKGRVALYALLKAMGVREGDEVIVPAFTCVVVPNELNTWVQSLCMWILTRILITWMFVC